MGKTHQHESQEFGAKMAYVARKKFCDFCREEGKVGEEADYDALTVFGTWACMCERHFAEYGKRPEVGFELTWFNKGEG